MDDKRLNLFPASIDEPKAKPVNQNGIRADRQQRELDRMTGTAKPKTMTIPLGTMVPLLMQAYENDHTWLADFADDMVQIDADLHEVLTAFQNMPARRAA